MSEDTDKTDNEEILLLKKQIQEKDEQIAKMFDERNDIQEKICEINREGRATLGIKNMKDWDTYTFDELYELSKGDNIVLDREQYGYHLKVVLTPKGHLFRLDVETHSIDVDRMFYWDGFKLWYCCGSNTEWYEEDDRFTTKEIAAYAENLAAEKAIEQAFFSEPE
jgi:hypothetical protein